MDRDQRLFAFLSYCSLFCLVPLLLKKDCSFVVFHGRQGLALFLCEMAAFVVSIVIPVIMQPFLFVFAAFSFLGMLKSLAGVEFKLPFVYALSEKLVL